MKTSFLEKTKKFFKSWEFVLLLILFFEIVIFATKNPKFLMPRVLFGSLNDIISICIISLFVTFVMITGGIDIQAGSIVGLSSIVLGVAWQDGRAFHGANAIRMNLALPFSRVKEAFERLDEYVFHV